MGNKYPSSTPSQSTAFSVPCDVQGDQDIESDSRPSSLPQKVGPATPSALFPLLKSVAPRKNRGVELGACGFFIAGLIAVVATLYPFQDKPQTKWGYDNSVNSLIALYVVVLIPALRSAYSHAIVSLDSLRCLHSQQGIQDHRSLVGAVQICTLP